MIKKSVFEEEIVNGMQRNLLAPEAEHGHKNLVNAIDYLGAASEIFEEIGMTAQADRVLFILAKIAKKHKRRKPKNPTTISDPHTKGLTPDKMVENLLHHGTEFNMSDDGINDLLNLDIGDEHVSIPKDELIEEDEDFEDEV